MCTKWCMKIPLFSYLSKPLSCKVCVCVTLWQISTKLMDFSATVDSIMASSEIRSYMVSSLYVDVIRRFSWWPMCPRQEFEALAIHSDFSPLCLFQCYNVSRNRLPKPALEQCSWSAGSPSAKENVRSSACLSQGWSLFATVSGRQNQERNMSMTFIDFLWLWRKCWGQMRVRDGFTMFCMS